MISLSSTALPATTPRCWAKVDSTLASSSTIRCRSSAGTWFGRRLAWSSSSSRCDVPLGAVRARFAHLAEELGVGERVGEGELGLDATSLVLLGRGDVGVPPRERRRVMERPQALDGPGDDVGRRAHGPSGYLRSRRGHRRTSRRRGEPRPGRRRRDHRQRHADAGDRHERPVAPRAHRRSGGDGLRIPRRAGRAHRDPRRRGRARRRARRCWS